MIDTIDNCHGFKFEHGPTIWLPSSIKKSTLLSPVSFHYRSNSLFYISPNGQLYSWNAQTFLNEVYGKTEVMLAEVLASGCLDNGYSSSILLVENAGYSGLLIDTSEDYVLALSSNILSLVSIKQDATGTFLSYRNLPCLCLDENEHLAEITWTVRGDLISTTTRGKIFFLYSPHETSTNNTWSGPFILDPLRTILHIGSTANGFPFFQSKGEGILTDFDPDVVNNVLLFGYSQPLELYLSTSKEFSLKTLQNVDLSELNYVLLDTFELNIKDPTISNQLFFGDIAPIGREGRHWLLTFLWTTTVDESSNTSHQDNDDGSNETYGNYEEEVPYTLITFVQLSSNLASIERVLGVAMNEVQWGRVGKIPCPFDRFCFTFADNIPAMIIGTRMAPDLAIISSAPEIVEDPEQLYVLRAPESNQVSCNIVDFEEPVGVVGLIYIPQFNGKINKAQAPIDTPPLINPSVLLLVQTDGQLCIHYIDCPHLTTTTECIPYPPISCFSSLSDSPEFDDEQDGETDEDEKIHDDVKDINRNDNKPRKSIEEYDITKTTVEQLLDPIKNSNLTNFLPEHNATSIDNNNINEDVDTLYRKQLLPFSIASLEKEKYNIFTETTEKNNILKPSTLSLSEEIEESLKFQDLKSLKTPSFPTLSSQEKMTSCQEEEEEEDVVLPLNPNFKIIKYPSICIKTSFEPQIKHFETIPSLEHNQLATTEHPIKNLYSNTTTLETKEKQSFMSYNHIFDPKQKQYIEEQVKMSQKETHNLLKQFEATIDKGSQQQSEIYGLVFRALQAFEESIYQLEKEFLSCTLGTKWQSFKPSNEKDFMHHLIQAIAPDLPHLQKSIHCLEEDLEKVEKTSWQNTLDSVTTLHTITDTTSRLRGFVEYFLQECLASINATESTEIQLPLGPTTSLNEQPYRLKIESMLSLSSYVLFSIKNILKSIGEISFMDTKETNENTSCELQKKQLVEMERLYSRVIDIMCNILTSLDDSESIQRILDSTLQVYNNRTFTIKQTERCSTTSFKSSKKFQISEGNKPRRRRYALNYADIDSDSSSVSSSSIPFPQQPSSDNEKNNYNYKKKSQQQQKQPVIMASSLPPSPQRQKLRLSLTDLSDTSETETTNKDRNSNRKQCDTVTQESSQQKGKHNNIKTSSSYSNHDETLSSTEKVTLTQNKDDLSVPSSITLTNQTQNHELPLLDALGFNTLENLHKAIRELKTTIRNIRDKTQREKYSKFIPSCIEHNFKYPSLYSTPTLSSQKPPNTLVLPSFNIPMVSSSGGGGPIDRSNLKHILQHYSTIIPLKNFKSLSDNKKKTLQQTLGNILQRETLVEKRSQLLLLKYLKREIATSKQLLDKCVLDEKKNEENNHYPSKSTLNIPPSSHMFLQNQSAVVNSPLPSMKRRFTGSLATQCRALEQLIVTRQSKMNNTSTLFRLDDMFNKKNNDSCFNDHDERYQSSSSLINTNKNTTTLIEKISNFESSLSSKHGMKEPIIHQPAYIATSTLKTSASKKQGEQTSGLNVNQPTSMIKSKTKNDPFLLKREDKEQKETIISAPPQLSFTKNALLRQQSSKVESILETTNTITSTTEFQKSSQLPPTSTNHVSKDDSNNNLFSPRTPQKRGSAERHLSATTSSEFEESQSSRKKSVSLTTQENSLSPLVTTPQPTIDGKPVILKSTASLPVALLPGATVSEAVSSSSSSTSSSSLFATFPETTLVTGPTSVSASIKSPKDTTLTAPTTSTPFETSTSPQTTSMLGAPNVSNNISSSLFGPPKPVTSTLGSRGFLDSIAPSSSSSLFNQTQTGTGFNANVTTSTSLGLDGPSAFERKQYTFGMSAGEPQQSNVTNNNVVNNNSASSHLNWGFGFAAPPSATTTSSTGGMISMTERASQLGNNNNNNNFPVSQTPPLFGSSSSQPSNPFQSNSTLSFGGGAAGCSGPFGSISGGFGAPSSGGGGGGGLFSGPTSNLFQPPKSTSSLGQFRIPDTMN